MNTSQSTPSTGPEMMRAIGEVTLDEALRRNPHSKPLSDNELMSLTKHLRAERTQIEVKKDKKREKKNDKD